MQNQITKNKKAKYTVKDVSKKLGISKHTVRYYETEQLIPHVLRDNNNIRLFSDSDLEWFKVVNCLRYSGLPVKKVKEYIDMCLEGDKTISKRAQIIAEQEKQLLKKMEEVKAQLSIIRVKKQFYNELLENGGIDRCNPENK